MDRFEQRLREDAARIRADVSPQLDERIRASLEAAAAEPVPAARPRRALSLWWASSLTGLAAALGLIVMINLWTTAGPPAGPSASPPQTVAGPAPRPAEMPILHAEAAVLTAPLEQELDDLEADLKKAREVVRDDLGL